MYIPKLIKISNKMTMINKTRYITLTERLANNPVLNETIESPNELPLDVNRHYPNIEINDTVQVIPKAPNDTTEYQAGLVTAIDADGITVQICYRRF